VLHRPYDRAPPSIAALIVHVFLPGDFFPAEVSPRHSRCLCTGFTIQLMRRSLRITVYCGSTKNDFEVLVHGILVDPVRVENPQSSQLAPCTTLIRTLTLQPISESTASTSAPCTGTHQRSSRLQPSPPSPYQHPTNNHDSRASDPLPPPPSLPRNPSHCSSRRTPGGDLV
jgi:hypothetical protein